MEIVLSRQSVMNKTSVFAVVVVEKSRVLLFVCFFGGDFFERGERVVSV